MNRVDSSIDRPGGASTLQTSPCRPGAGRRWERSVVERDELNGAW